MDHQDQLYILGASGHGAVVAEIAAAFGYQNIVFCDDDPTKNGKTVLGYPVIGDGDVIPGGSHVAIGIGSNPIRQRLLGTASEKNWILPVLIHPSAVISASATLGLGTVAMANAVVNARAKIGAGCILNTSCSIDHDCELGDAVHIAPGARLSGNVTVGNLSMLGTGSSVIQGITIGSNSIVGVGSVVVRDIADNVVAHGNTNLVTKPNE